MLPAEEGDPFTQRSDFLFNGVREEFISLI